jgi:hypothetical protein
MSEESLVPDDESQLKAVEQAAKLYTECGWSLTPLHARQKGTDIKGWTKGLSQERLNKAFKAGYTNLGILTGSISGGLVDIDLDCDEACDLFDQYFPETKAKFGRPSRNISHCLYKVPDPGRGMKFQDEILLDRQKAVGKEVHATIIEYRADGLQTMAPPSIHPDEEGRQLFWHNETYDPTLSTRDYLIAACAEVSLAVMNERYAIDEIKAHQLAWNNYQEWVILARGKASSAFEEIYSIESKEIEQSFSTPIIDPLSSKSTFYQINQIALKDLDSWVPYLGLKVCVRDPDGSYSCVPEWRESNTGRKLEQRGKNCSIDPRGIRDFGRQNPRTKNGGYTPIDIIIAMGIAEKADDAASWLTDKLLGGFASQDYKKIKEDEISEKKISEITVHDSSMRELKKASIGNIEKPKIYICPATPEITLKQLSCRYSECGRIYNRGVPVFIVHDKIYNANIAVSLDQNSGVAIAHEISRPWGYVKRGESFEAVDKPLPVQIVRMYLSRPDYHQSLPLLRGITSAPQLKEGGSFYCNEGYDRESCYFVEAMPEIKDLVPEFPSINDAHDALKLIRDQLSTFCFADSEKVLDEAGVYRVDINNPSALNESSALCALLTAVCRASLDLAPLICITAAETSGAGTGKGKLFRMICEIAFGRQPTAFTAGQKTNSEEIDKRIGASLIEGAQSIMLDNLNGMTLRSDTLASIVTENPATIRELGKSKMLKVTPSCFIGLTGNGLTLSEDLIRRAVTIELDAGIEDPESRRFLDDPVKTAKARRRELLAACLIIWRWGQQNDLDEGKSIGSFEQWGRWVRDPLVALGCKDPVLRNQEAKMHDPRRQRQAEIYTTWWQQHENRPVKLSELSSEVIFIIDPKLRGRQYVQSSVSKLVGTRVAGFVLQLVKRSSAWGVDQYILERTDLVKPAE